jgi:hypothetical protein
MPSMPTRSWLSRALCGGGWPWARCVGAPPAGDGDPTDPSALAWPLRLSMTISPHHTSRLMCTPGCVYIHRSDHLGRGHPRAAHDGGHAPRAARALRRDPAGVPAQEAGAGAVLGAGHLQLLRRCPGGAAGGTWLPASLHARPPAAGALLACGPRRAAERAMHAPPSRCGRAAERWWPPVCASPARSARCVSHRRS